MPAKEPQVDLAELQGYMQKAGISEPLLKFALRCPNCRRQFVLSDMIKELSHKTEAKCIECGEPIRAMDLFQSIKRIIGYDDYYYTRRNLARVEMDRYGRVLIPREVRERLGLKPKMTLEVTVRGRDIILRAKNVDLDKEVEELAAFLEREVPEPFVNESSKGDSKWLSRKYCLRKLGL